MLYIVLIIKNIKFKLFNMEFMSNAESIAFRVTEYGLYLIFYSIFAKLFHQRTELAAISVPSSGNVTSIMNVQPD